MICVIRESKDLRWCGSWLYDFIVVIIDFMFRDCMK